MKRQPLHPRPRISRAWRQAVAVSSLLLGWSVLLWPAAWQSAAFQYAFQIGTRWPYGIVWVVIGVFTLLDLWGPHLFTNTTRIVFATLYTLLAAEMSASILITTLNGSVSAFGSAIMWMVVAWLSLEHVRRFRQ